MKHRHADNITSDPISMDRDFAHVQRLVEKAAEADRRTLDAAALDRIAKATTPAPRPRARRVRPLAFAAPLAAAAVIALAAFVAIRVGTPPASPSQGADVRTVAEVERQVEAALAFEGFEDVAGLSDITEATQRLDREIDDVWSPVESLEAALLTGEPNLEGAI